MPPGSLQPGAAAAVESAARRGTVRTALAMIAVFLLAVGIWALPDPDGFVTRLGIGAEIPLIGWVVAVAAAALYAAYTLWAVPGVRPVARELSWFRVLAVPLAVLSGLIEEMFFRGWVMDLMQSFGLGAAGQLVLSAILFGSVHAVWVALGAGWRGVLPIIGSTIGLGLLMGAVYLLSGRVVLPAAVAHMLINLVVEPGLLLHAARRRATLRRG